jgi:hypothetical protein
MLFSLTEKSNFSKTTAYMWMEYILIWSIIMAALCELLWFIGNLIYGIVGMIKKFKKKKRDKIKGKTQNNESVKFKISTGERGAALPKQEQGKNVTFENKKRRNSKNKPSPMIIKLNG